MQTAIQANLIAVKLTALGVPAMLGECERDALRIDVKGMTLRGVIQNFGANSHRISWQGFAPTNSILHYMERPVLASTSTAKDGGATRIAKQLIARIIEPAAEPLAAYAAKIAAQAARIAALPAQIEKVRALGVTVHDCGPAGTEASFYLSRGDAASGNGRVSHDGRVYFERLSLDAETARCVLEFLAVRPKGDA